jgi:hypothetical protein
LGIELQAAKQPSISTENMRAMAYNLRQLNSTGNVAYDHLAGWHWHRIELKAGKQPGILLSIEYLLDQNSTENMPALALNSKMLNNQVFLQRL